MRLTADDLEAAFREAARRDGCDPDGAVVIGPGAWPRLTVSGLNLAFAAEALSERIDDQIAGRAAP